MPPTPIGRIRKPKPKPGSVPFGHAHRIALAMWRPESRPLKVADIAFLLTISDTAVRRRDAQLRPVMVGLEGHKCRRYSWASYLAYVEGVST